MASCGRMDRLASKVSVITGAAAGIGAALARQLAEAGAHLVLVDRDPAVAQLAASLPSAEAHIFDVGDPGAQRALADAVAARHGGADLVVANAGINVHGLFLEQSFEDLERIVRVNLLGVLYLVRALGPGMRRGGQVVVVSSLAGRVPFPYQTTYCATKYAVRGFAAALRPELTPRGIGVTAVMPGAVATRLLETASSYDRSASAKMAELMLRFGASPERVAASIVQAIRADTPEVLVGWDARLATRLFERGLLGPLLGAATRARSG
jgi:short-subunit dehydrogenase